MISPRLSTPKVPGVEFDRFLYAQVGDDHHGGMLSVVSALARAGVDPWEQAAILAHLPADSAERALCGLLVKLPAESGRPPDPVAVATRLVALLPRAPFQSEPAPAVDYDAGNRITRAADGLGAALFYTLCLLAFLGALLLLMHR